MARLITLGSGKGGTGKSFLAANLGLALARAGTRTCLVDLDLGCSDLHLMLGLLAPRRGILEVLRGEVSTIQEASTPVPGSPLLTLVPGSDETLRISGLAAAEVLQLAKGLSRIDADVVIVDLPAGVMPQVLDLFLAGDRQVVVSTSDPVSLNDARRLLALARVRRSARAQHAKPPRRPRVYTSLDDLVRDMNALREEAAEEKTPFCPALVVNRCREGATVKAEQHARTLSQQLGGIEVPLLAEIPEDAHVEASMRMLQPVVSLAPSSPAGTALQRLAQRLAQEFSRGAAVSTDVPTHETVPA